MVTEREIETERVIQREGETEGGGKRGREERERENQNWIIWSACTWQECKLTSL